MLAIAACVQLVVSWSVTTPRTQRPAPRRAPVANMLEAYDLMPVMKCLKLPDQDTVNACFDTLSPWLELTEDGNVVFSQSALNGFIGGSVGAIGTVIATMVKKVAGQGAPPVPVLRRDRRHRVWEMPQHRAARRPDRR